MFITLVTFIIVLSVLVFAHEMGHFWTARKFGVKAEEFGFGFPPRIGGIYKNEQGQWKTVWGSKEVKDAPGTVYSLNWLPLGGFVKIKGENGDNEDEPDSFASKKIWQRAIMLSAGVVMNIVLAAVLFSFGFMIGLPQGVEGINPRAIVSDQKVQIAQVLPDSPAKQAGLEMGDFVIGVNDNKFTTDEELQNFVGTRAGEELNYKISRGGEELSFKITPELREDTGRGGIGIAIATTGLVKYPWYMAIWEGIITTIFLTWAIMLAFYDLFKDLILGQGLSADIAGPVGIATITGRFAHMGFIYLLNFTALLSINLAILNFIPFPALDGGRILFLIIEKIKGSPVKRELENVIHNTGFIILMLLVLAVTWRDVARLGDVFKGILNRL